ncbi:beta strand repeat-containing protein [Luteolibacter sp. Populi]|uniref:beta strand repeat-containing protein n=1 Tax=Luteolibacter sp. Populi TaxID=3230487 RepID=UPI003467BCE6
MKQLLPSVSTNSVLLLAGLLFFPAGLQAAQMAYEGFDYPAGANNIAGQFGGSGWSGTWLNVDGGGANTVAGSLTAGANSPAGFDLRSTGNSTNLLNGRRVGRDLNTSASGPFGSRGYLDGSNRIGADGKTVYISFTQQPNGTALYYEFEFHRGNLGNGGRIAGIGNDQGGDNVHLRAPNGTHTLIAPGSTAVNFYVVRIDFKAGNNDVRVYRNPTSLTEPGVPTLTKLGAADMSFDGLSLGAFANDRTVAHDEIRLGETWADVTVPATAAPVITSQPRASSTSFAGGTVMLKAEASGQPLPTYQWFKDTTLLSGQTGATLTLSNLQALDAGAYHVVATNTQGPATSADAQVIVQATPPGLLAYEGFDYDIGPGNLPGKPGGIGWGAAWKNVTAGGGTILSGSLAVGTNAPNGYDAQSIGNAAQMTNGRRDGRLVDTSPTGLFGAAGYVDGSGNIGADGKTIYLSFLQQPDGTSKFYEFEFHRGDLGDPGRIGGIGNDTGDPNISLRTAGDKTIFGPASTGVNLYVVRIDFKPGNNDVYVYQNPISATEPGIPTLTKLAASDMSFNGLSIAAFDNGRTVKHDEIRLGQNWSDVIFGTSRRELTWVGDGTTNLWSTTAANWDAGTGATAFADGDPVIFNDVGSDTPAVSIPTPVSTASVTATNSTKNYTLGGAGAINSSGSLLKSGSGSLTITAPATFNSVITVDGGSLALNGTTTAGAGLNANAGTTTLGGTASLGGIVSTSGNLVITGATSISGVGSFVWIGNFPGANSSLTLEAGGSIDMSVPLGDSWVIGRDGGQGTMTQNGGTVTYNPPNRADAYLGASTSPVTIGDYLMNGGTLEMSNKRLTLALGPVTSHLTQSGGTINLRQLELGANLSGSGLGTGIYAITNGVMTVGAGGITSNSGQYQIDLGGGTIAAADNWSSTLAMALTSGNVTFDTGSHTVVLGGDLSGTGGITKTGTGTLVLTGFNSFGGPVAVNAGTIGGNGSSDDSALTVAAGAAIAPGDLAFAQVGTFFCETASLASGATFAAQVDSTIVDVDRLQAVGGSISLAGANLTLQEASGGTLPLGTELVLVDASTTLTGTFAGYPEGATLSAGANTFTIHYSANRVTLITVAGNAYSSWTSANGLDATPGKDPAFDADPEQDGISNGLEWILGGDPLAADAASLVTTTGSAATGLTLSFTREEATLGNASLILEWDADLQGSWNEVPISQAGGAAANGVMVTVDQVSTPDGVTVNIPAANSAGGKLFGRLRATMP